MKRKLTLMSALLMAGLFLILGSTNYSKAHATGTDGANAMVVAGSDDNCNNGKDVCKEHKDRCRKHAKDDCWKHDEKCKKDKDDCWRSKSNCWKHDDKCKKDKETCRKDQHDCNEKDHCWKHDDKCNKDKDDCWKKNRDCWSHDNKECCRHHQEGCKEKAHCWKHDDKCKKDKDDCWKNKRDCWSHDNRECCREHQDDDKGKDKCKDNDKDKCWKHDNKCRKDKDDCWKKNRDCWSHDDKSCKSDKDRCHKDQDVCRWDREDCWKHDDKCKKDEDDCWKNKRDCWSHNSDCKRDKDNCRKNHDECRKHHKECKLHVDICVTPKYCVQAQDECTIYKGYGCQKVKLCAKVRGGSDCYEYVWKANGCVVGCDECIEVSPDCTTDYTVTVIDKKKRCCTASDCIKVKVKDVRCDNGKIKICHKDKKNMEVGLGSVIAHLCHGDKLGECDDLCTPGYRLAGPATEVTDVVVAPNPGNGVFNISVPDDAVKGLLQVMDVSGRMVVNRVMTEELGETVKLDLTNAMTGIYIIRVSGTDGAVYTTKLLVQ